jgi:hypothetical protein
MLNVQAVADMVARGAELYRNFVPADWVPYPNLTAIACAAAGFLFAFWGSRLLRTIYILAFLAVGAAEGFKIGSELRIDTLVGLTFGAGIAALIGYLFYRWWVGVTAGAVAVLLVLAVAWPRIRQLDQGYRDYRSGLGGEYILRATDEAEGPAQYARGLSAYIWTQQRDFAWRLAFAAGLAWLLGVVLGLTLPKFTTVLGTSLVGVLLAAGGLGVLLWRNWPDLWNVVAAHPDWYLVGMGALLIVSAWHQVRTVRVVPAPPPTPQPQAPPAPSK